MFMVTALWHIQLAEFLNSVGHRGDRDGGQVPPARQTHRHTTYLLQDADGVPAALQPGGEAGRGGGVIVLGGLRQELTHWDLIRHHSQQKPAGKYRETQKDTESRTRGAFRDLQRGQKGSWPQIRSDVLWLSPISLTPDDSFLLSLLLWPAVKAHTENHVTPARTFKIKA